MVGVLCRIQSTRGLRLPSRHGGIGSSFFGGGGRRDKFLYLINSSKLGILCFPFYSIRENSRFQRSKSQFLAQFCTFIPIFIDLKWEQMCAFLNINFPYQRECDTQNSCRFMARLDLMLPVFVVCLWWTRKTSVLFLQISALALLKNIYANKQISRHFSHGKYPTNVPSL